MADRIDRNEKDLELNDTARSAARDARQMQQMRQSLGPNGIPEEVGAAGKRAERVQSDTGEKRADLAQADSSEAAAASAVGGVGGAAAGAAIGTVVGGPIGTAIGALAGALGGWWAAHASSVAADLTPEDDSRYRSEYESSPNRLADRGYDDVRPAYWLGDLARRNPDYRGRPFDQVEGDLQKGWTEDLRQRFGDWANVRAHAQTAYTRNPDIQPETPAERTVIRANETAHDRLSSGRSGLTRDDTVGY